MNTTSETSPALPDVHQSILTPEIIEQLFKDLQNYTEVLEVIPKYRERSHVANENVDLNKAKDLMLSGLVKGIQIRYVYDEQLWLDTLMITPSGVKIVRIQPQVESP